MRRALCLSLLFILPLAAKDESPSAPREKVLYNFEDAADLKGWSNLELPDAKDREPPAKIERASEHATSGKYSLKLTFAGGRWPTVTTTQVHDDWLAYRSLKADVTVSRPCVVGFTAHQEKSQRGGGWEALISRWTKTVFLKPGVNHIVAALPGANDYAIHSKWGKVVRFEIFMYQPHDGESIFVDNIRLSTDKETAPEKSEFSVVATDMRFIGTSSADAVIQMGKRLKGEWTPPKTETVESIEAEYRAKLTALKEKHPKAVLAVLRDGEKGYDPNQPDRVYAGWKDAYFTSHGPDSNFVERAQNRGKSASHEVFMRHRSPLMRVDLSSIPTGSTILSARLVIVRTNQKISEEHDPDKKPTRWVVEPCNRPWEENEVNAFEYAKDRFWKAIGGMSWSGDDPDFLPLFLAAGIGQARVTTLEFTQAVDFWTSGKHPNHGFMLHGDSHDYVVAHSREAKDVKDRPAVFVIYEPK